MVGLPGYRLVEEARLGMLMGQTVLDRMDLDRTVPMVLDIEYYCYLVGLDSDISCLRMMADKMVDMTIFKIE